MEYTEYEGRNCITQQFNLCPVVQPIYNFRRGSYAKIYGAIALQWLAYYIMQQRAIKMKISCYILRKFSRGNERSLEKSKPIWLVPASNRSCFSFWRAMQFAIVCNFAVEIFAISSRHLNELQGKLSGTQTGRGPRLNFNFNYSRLHARRVEFLLRLGLARLSVFYFARGPVTACTFCRAILMNFEFICDVKLFTIPCTVERSCNRFCDNFAPGRGWIVRFGIIL